MNFTPGQKISLPELAHPLQLSSSEFDIKDVICGGMGQCVCIVQRDHVFALKVLRADLLESSEGWSRYIRELEIWSTLSACDGVVEVMQIIRLNEVPAVCSRWMSGGNLRKHLANSDPKFFFSVIARVIGTLAWVYEQHKVIHRDLKPDNILLDESDQAFVSDWGLARPLTVSDPVPAGGRLRPREQTNSPALTRIGQILGTVAYASPEQLSGMAVDQRTDIYSLGCLMYEWEAGRWPFTGTTPEEIRQKHLFESPPTLGGLLRKTKFGIEDVIHRCLVKDPKRRIPDYCSLEDALAEAASRRRIQYQKFHPSTRYRVPMVGTGKFRSYATEEGGGNSAYTVRDASDVEPFLREAIALASIGENGKAADIYGRLFVAEIVASFPDVALQQVLAVNYASCLTALDRAQEAVTVLKCLAGAQAKPAEYFVNLSHAYLRTREFQAAASTATEGLAIYPVDYDLMGNLLFAQVGMEGYEKAVETAKIRLQHRRDVHSLGGTANLHLSYAQELTSREWPLALRHFRHAADLLEEARGLNPRHLVTRMLLLQTLERMEAYSRCVHEISGVLDLPWCAGDRAHLAYLQARCLDRVSDYSGCFTSCEKNLEWMLKNPAVPRAFVIQVERVRAMTLTYGYCIGKEKEGRRYIITIAEEFFARIVHDKKHRQAVDFCYLAELHEWIRKHREADSVLDEAAALYPKYWQIPWRKANFLMARREYYKAVGPAEEASRLAPWKHQTWQVLGDACSCAGLDARAEVAKKCADEVRQTRRHLAAEYGLG
jgi:serine/threonine protein kinase